jgi:hypothetical protein
MDANEEKSSYRTTTSFPRKELTDHVREFLADPLKLLSTFVAALGVIWLCIEISIQLLGFRPQGVSLLVVLAGLAGICWRFVQYVNECPAGFEATSKKARRLAQLQPRKWEASLALQLLAERIGPIDRECRRLQAGQEYVPSRQMHTYSEYWAWANDRPHNMKNMLVLTNQLLVHEFMPSIVSQNRDTSPIRILSAIEALERVYRASTEFDRETRTVIPPDGYERLHRLQFGWADPIRDAIRQLLQLLNKIREVDRKSNETLALEVNFAPPVGYEEYVEECDKLVDRIPELMQSNPSGFGI